MSAPLYYCSTEGAVALAAATAKTVIGAKAHANSGLLLKKVRYGFDGITSSAVPVLVELCYSTWATNGPGTNSTSTTPRQANGRVLAAGFTSGKMEAHYNRLLTPDGWRPMGEIEPDDAVLGSLGLPVRVMDKFPHGEQTIWRVRFSDGSHVDVGREHLWTVRIGSHAWRVRTTEEIFKHLATGRQRPSVPTMAPAQFAESDPLPMDPYQLGLLLGDGCFRGREITFASADAELVGAFGDRAVWRGQYDYGLLGMKAEIRALGLDRHYSYDKRVPRPFLWASAADRHALLQGLLDTDGTVAEGGSATFCTTSTQLADDVQFLAESLGGYATKRLRGGLAAERNRPAWVMTVVLPTEFPPFRLQRKAALWQPRQRWSNDRTITDVEVLVDTAEMSCIAVDAPDSLYATEHAILTHNTWTVEPTALTVIEDELMTPNGGVLWYDFPLSDEWDCALAEGFALRFTAPAIVNCRAILTVCRC